MPNRSSHAGECIAGLQLSLTDLRAHFEAQLRTVGRAEQSLLRCRGGQHAAAFDTAADTFRGQLTVIADSRNTIGALLKQIVDDARKLRFEGRAPKA